MYHLKMNFNIIRPLSTSSGAQHKEALPAPSDALKGAVMGVGTEANCLVYRCNWDDRSNTGSWAYLYTHEAKGPSYAELQGQIKNLEARLQAIEDRLPNTLTTFLN
jgi:hypothetical protein